MPSRTLPLWLLPAAVLWIFVIAGTWSCTPFWPDADGYTSHVAEGRWVAHPPGYLFFVALGRGWHALGLPAYSAVQAAGLLLTAAALPVLYAVFRRVTSRVNALWLLAAFAFSANVLVLSRTGTSHAADYFTVSLLLLLATSAGFRAGRFWPCVGFGAALVVCAGFRMTTAIMMAPFVAVVLLRNIRNPSLWISLVLAGLAVIALQSTVIRLSGGWIPYSEYSQAMHAENLHSSVILQGVSSATLLNVARALGWWGMSLSALLVLPLIALWRRFVPVPSEGEPETPDISGNRTEMLLYGGASAAGCLGMSALYLCTHPGYISAALPGSFAVLAALAPFAPTVRLALASIGLSLGFFLFARPFLPPKKPLEAAANGLVLQYGGEAIRKSIYQSTSGWLRQAGFNHLVPDHRQAPLDTYESRTK
ncbi:MAG TPA: hypothetical protein PLS03_00190 [Terrimicrobiaceae bacterium]|nr:hypothetical protein [Terrimicrobiaceae bacterium]